jgi:hypothetical protein
VPEVQQFARSKNYRSANLSTACGRSRRFPRPTEQVDCFTQTAAALEKSLSQSIDQRQEGKEIVDATAALVIAGVSTGR